MGNPGTEAERAATAEANHRIDRLTSVADRIVPFHRWRPLDRVPSIKLKLSILILAAVAVTVATSTIAFWLDLRARYGVAAAVVLALVMVQVLARGLTTPIRDLTAATAGMADGDYAQQVEATGADEIGQLGRNFNQMSHHIVELEQQRRDLIANVSHELRTPIAVIQGNLENMLDGVSNDDAATIETMHRQVQRLGRLVQRLLDLSRIEAGETPMLMAPMSLADAIDDVVAEARLRTPTPDIEVCIDDTAGARGHKIEGDAQRLHQVLANLMDNALAHGSVDAGAARDGPAVEVTLRAETDHLVVSIRDRGPGIDPTQLDHIFDRYVGSTLPTSTGLGLAIARRIVELHHGTISATNTAPGCRFDVSLPTA